MRRDRIGHRVLVTAAVVSVLFLNARGYAQAQTETAPLRQPLPTTEPAIQTSAGAIRIDRGTPKAIIDDSLPSVVSLTVWDKNGALLGTGSGFVVSEDRIVTNMDVVLDAYSVTVEFPKGPVVPAKGIRGVDLSSNIAILEVPTGSARPLPLATYPLGFDQVGIRATGLSAPRGSDTGACEGYVTSLRRDARRSMVIENIILIMKGSAGGPLLDQDGKVIGVNQPSDSQYRGMAYAVDYVRDALDHPFRTCVSWEQFQADYADRIRIAHVPKEQPIIYGRALTPSEVAEWNAQTSSPPPVITDSGLPAPSPRMSAIPPPSPPPGGEVEIVGRQIRTWDVVVVNRVPPSIPDRLRSDKLRTSTATFRVKKDGTFTLSVTSSGNAEVDKLVRQAMEKWRFRPAYEDGKPIDSTYEVRIDL